MLPLSHKKKETVRRSWGQLSNTVRRRTRVVLQREQDYEIGGTPVVLPAECDLPFYQRRDPSYDAYAIPILRKLASSAGSVLVVDVGANVGDTAVAALSAAPNIDVVAVEGGQYFLSYLRRNLQSFGDRVRIVEGFVGPIGQHHSYNHNGRTGGFGSGVAVNAGPTIVTDWVSAPELLDGQHQLKVWKSDTDGFDIHILVQHWDRIAAEADAIWFEFDPVGTCGDKADIGRLADLIGAVNRPTFFFDNVGHLILGAAAGTSSASAMRYLAAWLVEQRTGLLSVPYLDVWVLSDTAAAGAGLSDESQLSRPADPA